MTKTWAVAAILFGTWTVGAVSVGAPSQMPPGQPADVAAAVAEIGELGSAMYGLANDNNWDPLFEKLDALDKIASSLRPEADEGGKAKQRLTECITDLAQSAAARDSLGAMQAANQITLIAADLGGRLGPQPPVPTDVARLDYYGRELQIWSEDKNEAKLRQTADALQAIWNQVRGEVLRRGGLLQARRFDSLVAEVQAAKSFDQYAALVPSMVDAVDGIEKLFTK